MSKSHPPIVAFRCARCGVMKPATEFHPLVDDGFLIRSDSCAACCQEIAAIHRRRRALPRSRAGR